MRELSGLLQDPTEVQEHHGAKAFVTATTIVRAVPVLPTHAKDSDGQGQGCKDPDLVESLRLAPIVYELDLLGGPERVQRRMGADWGVAQFSKTRPRSNEDGVKEVSEGEADARQSRAMGIVRPIHAPEDITDVCSHRHEGLPESLGDDLCLATDGLEKARALQRDVEPVHEHKVADRPGIISRIPGHVA